MQFHGIKDSGIRTQISKRWDVNRVGYVTQFMDRLPKGTLPLVNSKHAGLISVARIFVVVINFFGESTN